MSLLRKIFDPLILEACRPKLRLGNLRYHAPMAEKLSNASYFDADLFQAYIETHRDEFELIIKPQFTSELLKGSYDMNHHSSGPFAKNIDVDVLYRNTGDRAYDSMLFNFNLTHETRLDIHEGFHRFFGAIERKADVYIEDLTTDRRLKMCYDFDRKYISPYNRALILSFVMMLGAIMNNHSKAAHAKALSGKVQDTTLITDTLKGYKKFTDFVGKTYLGFRDEDIALLQAIPYAPDVSDISGNYFVERAKLVETLIPQPMRKPQIRRAPPKEYR